jgi:hypothetical protein
MMSPTGAAATRPRWVKNDELRVPNRDDTRAWVKETRHSYLVTRNCESAFVAPPVGEHNMPKNLRTSA